MNKHQAHDIVHQWNGGKAENCPGCTGDMSDTEMMSEAKKIAMSNYKPKTNPMLPFDQRMMQYAELPDSDFAYIDSKGDRHLPLHDEAQVKEAISKFDETVFADDSAKDEARKKVDTAAVRFGLDKTSKGMNDILRPMIDVLSFAEGSADGIPSTIKLIPVGKYNMTRYGMVDLTKEKLLEMKKHFDEGIRAGGKKAGLPIDIEHGDSQYKDAAAGWIKDIEVRNDGAYGKVDWTELGIKLLKGKIYKFYSPEFHFKYKDPQHSFDMNNVMTGGGLVNKPMIKDDLPALVNSETGKTKNLTKEESPITIYVELEKSSEKQIMKLSEIIAKEKSTRTSEEQKFVIEHQDELTFAEAKTEGLVPEATTVKKEEKVEELKLKEGETVVSKDKLDELVKMAERGVAADDKLKRAELKEEIKTLVFSEKGSKLPADQIDVAVDLIMSMSEENAKKYKEQLKALPEKQIFGEIGNAKETSGTASGDDLHKKALEFAEKNKVAYAEALKAVVAADKVAFGEYAENLPVAQAER